MEGDKMRLHAGGLLHGLQLPNEPQEEEVEHKEGTCQSSDEACSAWIHNNYFLFQACFVSIRVLTLSYC